MEGVTLQERFIEDFKINSALDHWWKKKNLRVSRDTYVYICQARWTRCHSSSKARRQGSGH